MMRDQLESHELLRRSSSDSESFVANFELPGNKPRAEKERVDNSALAIFLKPFHCLSFLLSARPFHRRQRPQRRGSLCRRLIHLTLHITVGIIGSLVALSILRGILYPSYDRPPAHYLALRDAITSSTRSGRGNPSNEKIFIATNIVKEDFVRGAWGEAVVQLVELLGEENVFLSVYENDSGPGTAEALRELGNRVPCNTSIVAGGHLPLDGFPTITIPSGEQRVKRLAYLAEVRNRVLRPLDPNFKPSTEPSDAGFQHANMTFDRVLFINDVYFSPLDAVQLLFSTNADENGRANYRTACAVDFVGLGFMFYDSFVSRDFEGYEMGHFLYPWFAPAGREESRQDVLDGKDAVRVKSCWGGMAAFDAKFFQQPVEQARLSHQDETPPATVTQRSSLLQFRHEPEIYLESAECCLIHADIATYFPPSNSSTSENVDTGVYINPFVRVAYSASEFSWLPTIQRFERSFSILQWICSKIAYPEYNARRTQQPGQIVPQKTWVYDAPPPTDRRLMTGEYKTIERTAVPGGYCGQRRLFVMKDVVDGSNRNGVKNWEKLPTPSGYD